MAIRLTHIDMFAITNQEHILLVKLSFATPFIFVLQL